jgi:large subunit ribosomal protein L30
MAREKQTKTLAITWTKSAIGYSQRQKDTVRGLGLLRLNQTVERPDTPEIRGMVEKVKHLVKVEEVA